MVKKEDKLRLIKPGKRRVCCGECGRGIIIEDIVYLHCWDCGKITELHIEDIIAIAKHVKQSVTFICHRGGVGEHQRIIGEIHRFPHKKLSRLVVNCYCGQQNVFKIPKSIP